MTAIHEITQVMLVDTPFGKAQALFIIDYGIHLNTIWVCASVENGAIRHFDTNQINVTTNHTMNLNTNK
jgi:hypothetical protein